ncbi:MAG: T9SS type A sorting domain-containing protein [candidate division KSB1 bacterium]|nr:T9SS type A sorting domain-containing protein [candidate division KSB1 bacterium]
MALRTWLILIFWGLASSLLAQNDTYTLIQQSIFNRYCVSCHQPGTSFARQSGLVLTADSSYAQLVNVPPKNSAAREDGLFRVSNEGLAGLYKSFLWEKVNAPDQEHFYSDHPYYGAIMPLGGPALTNGELKLIREWIIAGAPRQGQVVDPAVLDDTTRYTPPEFVALEPPQNGIQFHLGPFPVQPNFDREFFYYEPLNHNEDRFIKRIEMRLRPGSHHFILYTYRDDTPYFVMTGIETQARTYRDIRDANGNYIGANLFPMQFQQFFAGTQWPALNYHFPPGVALRLPSGKGFDLNAHYANRSSSEIQGEIYVNLHFADPSEIEHIAEVLFLNNTDIYLPPQQVTTLTKTYYTQERMHIFQLFSHAHEHMTEFRVEIAGGPRDGELIYIAYDWEHPPILEIDPPLTLEPGQGLRLITTYNNTTDRALGFGLLSSEEMMILFGYYYTDQVTGVANDDLTALPDRFALRPNYPNPFNPETTLEFELPVATEVRLAIYDATGREVAVLAQGLFTAGRHRVIWNAVNQPSGIYFARLSVGGHHWSQKLLLVR